MGILQNLLGIGLTNNNPIKESPFTAPNDEKSEGHPPVENYFLLLDGSNFLLLDGTDFLLL